MDDLIAGHIRHIRAAGHARTTVFYREELLRRLDRDLPMGLERATIEELEDWLCRDGWTAKTRATYHEHVAAFYRWACDPKNPRLDYDPSAGLTRPRAPKRAPKPVTDEELADVLTLTTGFWHLAAVLAAYAGLRCCEISTIRREEITEEIITVQGKGGREDTLPTHDAIWRLVRDFPGGSVATHVHGRPVTAQYISALWPRHVTRATGRKGISLHRLRHWYATNLLSHGADLRTVQELCRHASPATTAIYTKITDRQRRIAVATLPVLAPSPC